MYFLRFFKTQKELILYALYASFYVSLVKIGIFNFKLKGAKMLKKFVTLIMGITLGVFFVGCGSSPKDVAVSFMEDAYKGNGDKLIKYVYIPKKEEIGGKELAEGKLKAAAQRAKETAQEAGGLKNIEVVSEEIKEKSAHIELRVHFKNGNHKVENVRLVNDDGKWKIRL
ncbi:DUF4878 domain-containing protein [Helicobacter sp.]|uniref:DUF4878 domain-containing protein n=1 Tax=Helicobacter sp. TaxID=218 RepID=UPI0025B9EAB5|nr:DUF4878 domain-containing protein [Helicobacter sp.]